jgi:hypothetical protein
MTISDVAGASTTARAALGDDPPGRHARVHRQHAGLRAESSTRTVGFPFRA